MQGYDFVRPEVSGRVPFSGARNTFMVGMKGTHPPTSFCFRVMPGDIGKAFFFSGQAGGGAAAGYAHIFHRCPVITRQKELNCWQQGEANGRVRSEIFTGHITCEPL